MFGFLVILVAFFMFVAWLGTIPGQLHARKLERVWATWPTLELYLANNPQAKTARGPACRACNSRNIHEFRWDSKTPNLRIHRCRTCNTTLYRSLL